MQSKLVYDRKHILYKEVAYLRKELNTVNNNID